MEEFRGDIKDFYEIFKIGWCWCHLMTHCAYYYHLWTFSYLFYKSVFFWLLVSQVNVRVPKYLKSTAGGFQLFDSTQAKFEIYLGQKEIFYLGHLGKYFFQPFPLRPKKTEKPNCLEFMVENQNNPAIYHIQQDFLFSTFFLGQKIFNLGQA